MIKRALVLGVVAILIPLFSPVSARAGQGDLLSLQQLNGVTNGRSIFAQPNMYAALDRSMSGSVWDRQTFSVSTGFDWIGRAPDALPPLHANLAPASRSPVVDNDSSKGLVDISRPDSFYVTGEVGFLYAVSSGKYGGETKAGYIVGEVGDDRFHITVGASQEESSFRLPRYRR